MSAIPAIPTQPALALTGDESKNGPGPLYTAAERAQALAQLMPSLADAVLGAGWDDIPTPSPPSSPSLSGSSASTPPSGATTPPTDALLVRSCRQGWDRSFELHSHWPRPGITHPSEVLVRNLAVGLNPVDWKSVIYNFGIADCPWVLGRDVAGVVEEAGPEAAPFKKGDRVWTCADSRDTRAGAYQRFSIARAETLGRIPDNVDDLHAATVGTGLVTAAVVVYWFFRLPTPSGKLEGRVTSEEIKDKWIMIYGGGAVTGIYAAQLAALSGLRVLAVASPSNFDYLRSVGVSACVDRFTNPDDLLAEISNITQGKLAYAIDCVGSKTATLCHASLDHGGQLVALAGNPKPEPSSKDVTVHKISFSTTFYGIPEFSRTILDEFYHLFKDGRLQPVRPELVPDGLAGIRKGLEALRDGTAPRAKKLVVRIADTPPADVTHLGVRSELSWNGVV